MSLFWKEMILQISTKHSRDLYRDLYFNHGLLLDIIFSNLLYHIQPETMGDPT